MFINGKKVDKVAPLMVWSMHIPPEQKQLVINEKIKTHGCMIHTSDGEWIEID